VPALALPLLLLATSSARAEPIIGQFIATINSVDAPLAGTFSVGQTLSGSFLYESSTAPRTGSNSQFGVFDALSLVEFETPAYLASSTGAPEIQIDNDPGSPFTDRFGLVARASDGLTGSNVNGLALQSFGFRLDDSTNTVFTTALVLPTQLQLSQFTTSAFFIFFGNGTDLAIVSGQFTRFEVAPVPEPTSLTLISLGVAGLGIAFRRRLRTTRSALSQ
jgi:hypothetical protein